MLGMSDDAWLRIVSISYFIAASLAAIFTILSIAAGVMQYRISNKISDDKDRALAEYKQQSDEKLASANSKAAEANKAAAKANVEAADANTKAAELNNQTARLEADNLRMKKQMAWRDIEPKQRDAIVGALKKYVGSKVAMMSIIGDTEGRNYADQFAEEFKAAGWDVNDSAQGAFSGNPVGVIIAISPQDKNDPSVALAVEALSDVLFELKIVPDRTIALKNDAPRGRIVLIVGAKPPMGRAG